MSTIIGSSVTMGKGIEVNIETEAEATVTATNTGTIVTAIASSSGIAKLKLSKYGDWSIIATKGGIESPSITVTIPPSYLISFSL